MVIFIFPLEALQWDSQSGGDKVREEQRLRVRQQVSSCVKNKKKASGDTFSMIQLNGLHMCSLSSNYSCLWRLKDAFKVPLWDGLKFTQILLCLSTHSYYIPPDFSTPACSLVSVLACIVRHLWGRRRSPPHKRGSRGWEISQWPTQN